MKQILIVFAMALSMSCFAQSYKETFDSNSLEWTECAYESRNGTAIIENGKMTVTSKGENKAAGLALSMLSGVATKVGANTFFETHCYAPLDIQKPFTIRTHVNIEKLSVDRIVGLVFNYKDAGNFYCFTFNNDMVRFSRYVNNMVVGYIEQGVKWADRKKVDHEWELVSDGRQLNFVVNGMPIMKVKHMPLDYTGVGFYTFGKQELVVDDIEFIQ
ncbi:MAG: hypothetical protein IKJ90_05180 [Bacteroidaceae bacterium]|nr:hypothetical protein [Bacteroidaceae bacterium]